MAYGGLRLRGGQTSQCLEERANAGATVSQALRDCMGNQDTLRLPNGQQGVQMNLVQDTLEYAGASQETRTLANSLIGEVTLRAGGPLGTENARPTAALLSRYEQRRQEADQRLRAAIDEYVTTGTVSDATLRQISVPGQPLPRAALDALAAMQADAVRRESLIGRLATGTAITQLTWECHQLQDELIAAAEGNQHLTDEARRLYEKRVTTLKRSLEQVKEKVDIQERYYQPAVQALMTEYANVQALATGIGLRAGASAPAPMPFGTQNPIGYGR
jgi:hypothetical protein